MGFGGHSLSKTAELDLQDSSKSAQEVEKSQNETLLWVVHSSPTLFNAICNAQGQFECATLIRRTNSFMGTYCMQIANDFLTPLKNLQTVTLIENIAILYAVTG